MKRSEEKDQTKSVPNDPVYLTWIRLTPTPGAILRVNVLRLATHMIWSGSILWAQHL